MSDPVAEPLDVIDKAVSIIRSHLDVGMAVIVTRESDPGRGRRVRADAHSQRDLQTDRGGSAERRMDAAVHDYQGSIR